MNIPPDKEKPRLRRTDMQVHIVGCSHYIAPEELAAFVATAPERQFRIVPEPTNKFNHHAVAVKLAGGTEPRTVAYVSDDDLWKIHLILSDDPAESRPLKILGLQPGRHTTMLAYPCRADGSLLMEIVTQADAQSVYLRVQDSVFDTVGSHIAEIPLEWKKLIYHTGTYIRDNLGADVPQSHMTLLRRSIESEMRAVPQQGPTVQVNGNVGQMPMGAGFFNPQQPPQQQLPYQQQPHLPL